VAILKVKYHYLGCQSELKGDSESETILTLLISI